MDSKLTLKLNSKIIEKAKRYAKSSDTSLSKLIENYISVITSTSSKERKVNPIIKSITGVIKLDDKRDYKKSYANYLTEKYK